MFKKLVLLIAITGSTSAYSISISSKNEPTNSSSWTQVSEGVYAKTDISGERHSYSVGKAGARHDREEMARRLKLIVLSDSLKGEKYQSEFQRNIRQTIAAIDAYLDHTNAQKVKEIGGNICSNNINWGLETSAINAQAYGYGYFEMYANEDTYAKEVFTYADVDWVGGTGGYDDTDFAGIPIGYTGDASALSSVSGSGQQLISLYGSATAITQQCEGVYRHLESEYFY